MMTYYDKVKKENRKMAIKAIALSLMFVGIAFGAVPFFTWMDCQNATRWTDSLERCIASNDCTLNAREARNYRAYLRLEVMRCTRPNPPTGLTAE